ncbi:MAG TPA: hypothetical protein VMZ30_05045, partial [Pyrinomonadaceae bacterium]|nr:hypothetical protein [Pyrinomonadaceae bacterium]
IESDFLSTVHGVCQVSTDEAYALLSMHRAVRLLHLKTPDATPHPALLTIGLGDWLTGQSY